MKIGTETIMNAHGMRVVRSKFPIVLGKWRVTYANRWDMCSGKRKMPKSRPKSFSGDKDGRCKGGKWPRERFRRRGSELTARQNGEAVGDLELCEDVCTCQEVTEEGWSESIEMLDEDAR